MKDTGPVAERPSRAHSTHPPVGPFRCARLGFRSAPTRDVHRPRRGNGGIRMEDSDWNLPYSARRLDHTRLHSCSVAELVPSTASAGRNFEQSSPSATADLSCSASVVTRALCDSRCRFQPPSHVRSHRLGRGGEHEQRTPLPKASASATLEPKIQWRFDHAATTSPPSAWQFYTGHVGGMVKKDRAAGLPLDASAAMSLDCSSRTSEHA